MDWTHQADKLLEDAVAASITLRFELLEDLLSAVRMAFQQSHDLAFEGVELAGAFGFFAFLITGLGDPLGDASGVELQFGGDLRDRQMLLCGELSDLAKSGVIDHGAPPPKARRRMSATDWACPARAEAAPAGPAGGSGRDST